MLFRTFRNTDPPRLVDVWNDTFTGRGTALLPNSTLLERFIFGKQLFDPHGLILAEDDAGICAGFAHASLGCPDGGPVGATCLIGVRPAYRRHGVGSELLRRCEAYLAAQGTHRLIAGGHWPNNPFYVGLYGGCESPGFLRSDEAAEPFLLRHGYRVGTKIQVLHRSLDAPLKVFDARFLPLRPRFEIRLGAPRGLPSSWAERVYGAVDPLEATIVDRSSETVAGHALYWEMDGFSWRWKRPAVGIFGFEIAEAYRRKGLGRFFLFSLLRQMQEQFFSVAEIQIEEDNPSGPLFLRDLGFEQVDTGQVFFKETPV